MASSSQNTSAKYDVFISFRGEDVRLGFLSHLKTKLKRKDIDAFVDDRLEIGDKISSALFRAIEISKSSLVIFSENYAKSTWCLDELVKIVDCMYTREHVVIPVFYNIDPSVVRHQIGPYKDAFDQHEQRHNKEKVQLWRSALLVAANISGFHYSKFSPLSPKDEAELVKKIAEILVRKLKCDSSTNFNVNEYDNGIRESMSMEIADNNNNANQNKNKKEKMYLSLSHLVGGNMVANGDPQPQYYGYSIDGNPYYGYSIDGNPYQATTTTPATTINDLIRFDERQQHHFNRWLNLQNEKQFGGEGYGLQRCGKSCRLRPDIKRGRFSFEEEEAIIQLHSILGNKWSAIAARLPGRTNNEIKNYWNTHIRKRLLRMGIDPVTHTPRLHLLNVLLEQIQSWNSQVQIPLQEQFNSEFQMPIQTTNVEGMINNMGFSDNSQQNSTIPASCMGDELNFLQQNQVDYLLGDPSLMLQFQNNLNQNKGYDSVLSTPSSSTNPLNSSGISGGEEERDSYCFDVFDFQMLEN